MRSDPYSLNALEDIMVPDPVGLFPFAPFWWFASAIAAVWIVYGLFTGWIHYRRNAYRRQGVKLIHELHDAASFETGLREVNEILKRVAIAAFSRERVASLWGSDWIDFLKASMDGFPFNRVSAEALAKISFTSLPDQFGRDEYAATLEAATAWILQHDRGDDTC